ncbi:MAG: tRNA (guanosine(37)-N1)-methyltransferase TrmD [Candidatus Omnitrophota bacterium]
MRIDIITIFPGMFDCVLNESMMKRAQAKKRVRFYIHDLRNYTQDKHRKVDDRPFGGGSGMVMRPEPIFNCVEKIKSKIKRAKVVLFSAQGKVFNQALAKKFAKFKNLILICGHYEGVDERVRRYLVDEEVSIGDYILTGGELPAMAFIDAVVRLLPGVLGDKNSLNFESFEGNLLEYPHYTRPANYKNMGVPKVLLSGDHKKISVWRKKESIRVTAERRPDLFEKQIKEEK